MFDVASGECELVDFLLTRFNPLDLKTKITVDPRCRVDEQIAPKPVDPDFPEKPSEPDPPAAVETPVVPPLSAMAPTPTPVQEAEAVVSPTIASDDAPEEPSSAPSSPSAVATPAEPIPAAPKIELKLSLPIPPATTPIAPEATTTAPEPEPANLPSAKEPTETPASVVAKPEELPSLPLSEPSSSQPTPPKPGEVKGDAPPSASDLLALIQGFHAAAQRYNSETAWEPPVVSPDDGIDHEE